MAASGVLLLDLGNRRLKLAGSASGEPGAVATLEIPRDGDKEAWRTLEERLEARAAAAAEVRICSSNPAALARLWEGALAGRRVRVAAPPWPFPVASRGTGPDRLLAAWAAWRRAAGAAVVVADAGSAWTLDCMDAGGVFLGGAIGCGLAAQEEALQRACPHLPLAGDGCRAGIPADTESALASGTREALAAALEVLATRFLRAAGGAGRRFLTGGDAERLAPWMEEVWLCAPDLVLEGLAALPQP